MSSFDPITGTPESAWVLDAVAALPLPRPGDHVLVVSAHPDDETLGTGGLIAACTRLGVPVSVVVATDGEASHPGSTTHSAVRLAEIRRVEVQAAVHLLAPGVTVRFLGLPDGELKQHRAALAGQLAHFARAATHLVSPWTDDRHPDHEACGEVAAEVAHGLGARHWQYPIWAWHWAEPNGKDLPWASLRRIPLTDADRDAKAGALRCHRSQHSALSDRSGDEAILSGTMLAHFARPSDYVLVATTDADDASAPGYFDALYERSPDPWGLAQRFYERRKRAMVLAALPRERFRRAFEPGCATGIITEELIRRCDEVVGWDVAGQALQQARSRLGDIAGITVESGRIPDQWPAGTFDLVLLSEVGYYCRDLDLLVERVLAALDPDGVVVACHWRHEAPDHPHTAAAVHRGLDAHLHAVTTVVDEDFLLHVWNRTGQSVATADGLLG